MSFFDVCFVPDRHPYIESTSFRSRTSTKKNGCDGYQGLSLVPEERGVFFLSKYASLRTPSSPRVLYMCRLIVISSGFRSRSQKPCDLFKSNTTAAKEVLGVETSAGNPSSEKAPMQAKVGRLVMKCYNSACTSNVCFLTV